MHLSDDMLSLPFLTQFRWKHTGEITFIGEISTGLLCGPMFHFLNSWFLLVHCFSSNMFSKLLKMTTWGLQRNKEYFAQPSNMYCLFTETYWSEVDNIEYYWSLLTVIYSRFNWIAGKMANTIAQRKFIDWKKTKLFLFRWNWDEEKNLRGIRLQISSPSPPRRASPGSPQPVPQFV